MSDNLREVRGIASCIRENRRRAAEETSPNRNPSRKRKRASLSPKARKQRKLLPFTPVRKSPKAPQKSPENISKSARALRERNPQLSYADPSLSSMSEESLPIGQSAEIVTSEDEEGGVNFDSLALAQKDWEDLHIRDEPTTEDLAFLAPEEEVVNDEASFEEGEEEYQSSFEDSSAEAEVQSNASNANQSSTNKPVASVPAEEHQSVAGSNELGSEQPDDDAKPEPEPEPEHEPEHEPELEPEDNAGEQQSENEADDAQASTEAGEVVKAKRKKAKSSKPKSKDKRDKHKKKNKKKKKSKKIMVEVTPQESDEEDEPKEGSKPPKFLAGVEEAEQQREQLEADTSPESKSNGRTQFVRSMCRLLETLSQHGVSLVVSATHKTGKLKALVFGDTEFSVKTAPTVDIEVSRPTHKAKDNGSLEQMFGLPKSVVDALRNCRFSQSARDSVSKLSARLAVDNTAVDSGSVSLFVTQEKLPEMDFDERTSTHISAVLTDLERLHIAHVDVTVMIKLKMFYLGGVLDLLATKYRGELRSTAGANVPDRLLEGKVNERLYDLFGKSVKDGTLAGMTPGEYDTRDAMSCPPQSPVKRDGFCTWKCRLAKFYAVCKFCKDLLYSDLSYTFIARSFGDFESAKQMLQFIKDHPEEYPNWNY